MFYLQGCELEGEKYDAVLFIKSETQQQLLQVSRNDKGVTAKKASGISLSKVEKGCLIFAKDEQKGYQVAIVDNTKKQGDSKYWKDNFPPPAYTIHLQFYPHCIQGHSSS